MIVYKCTCLDNGKIYVGVTVNPLSQRISHHKSSARRGSKLLFHLAINKHGFDRFVWEIIYEAQTIDELFEKEKFFISLYSSHGSCGYNMTDGGEVPNAMFGSKNGMFGKTHSDEVKEKLREIRLGISWEDQYGVELASEIKIKLANSHRGRRNTEETLAKMSANSYWKDNGHLIEGDNNPNFGHYWDESKKDKIRGEKNGMFGVHRTGSLNGMFGKKHTEESKAQMSESRAGINNPRYRPIDCLDLAISVFKETNSIARAAKAVGENYNKIKREFILNGIISKD